MKFIATTVADVEKLKSRAKDLKRKFKIKHREALEKAAREAGYLHWHHVTQCQSQSDTEARHLTLKFLCTSMVKDALKGETHYIAGADPFPFVLFANGGKSAVLLDSETQDCLLLAHDGEELQWVVTGEDEGTVAEWNATYVIKTGMVEIKLNSGSAKFEVPANDHLIAECVTESLDEYRPEPDMHVHDFADPASQALFRQMFLGEGLEPITDENKALLLAKGYSAKAVDDAIATGAKFSRPRVSIVMPMEEI